MAVPTWADHTPALTGECTPAAAMSACLSNVCEDDDLCGYRLGTPCTASEVCRSFICAPGGLCGECDATTPCPTGLLCDIPSGTCVPGDGGAPDGGIDGVPGGLAGGAVCSVTAAKRTSGALAMLGLVGLAGLVVARRRRR